MNGLADHDRAAVIRFVRDTLGCGCPDDVFDFMDIGPLPSVAGGRPALQLVVGGRLLIRLVEPPLPATTAGWLEDLANAGRATRDARDYNRFRLVLVAPHGEALPAGLDERFTATVGGDQRAHLHVIAADQLPATLSVQLAGGPLSSRAGPSDAK
jgi:hypothetical protein